MALQRSHTDVRNLPLHGAARRQAGEEEAEIPDVCLWVALAAPAVSQRAPEMFVASTPSGEVPSPRATASDRYWAAAPGALRAATLVSARVPDAAMTTTVARSVARTAASECSAAADRERTPRRRRRRRAHLPEGPPEPGCSPASRWEETDVKSMLVRPHDFL